VAGLFLVRLFMIGRTKVAYEDWHRFLRPEQRTRRARPQRHDPWG
jgi:hypothetical protein